MRETTQLPLPIAPPGSGAQYASNRTQIDAKCACKGRFAPPLPFSPRSPTTTQPPGTASFSPKKRPKCQPGTTFGTPIASLSPRRKRGAHRAAFTMAGQTTFRPTLPRQRSHRLLLLTGGGSPVAAGDPPHPSPPPFLGVRTSFPLRDVGACDKRSSHRTVTLLMNW